MSRLVQRGSQIFPSISVDDSVDDLERVSEDSEVFEDVPINWVDGSTTPQNEDPDILREEDFEVFEDVPLNREEGSRSLQNEDPNISREEDSENPEDLEEIFLSPTPSRTLLSIEASYMIRYPEISLLESRLRLSRLMRLRVEINLGGSEEDSVERGLTSDRVMRFPMQMQISFFMCY